IHRFGAFVSELQCRCWILMYRAGGRRSCREAAAAGNRCDRRALWRVLKDSLLLPKGMSCDESKPVRSRFACRRDPLTQKAAVMIDRLEMRGVSQGPELLSNYRVCDHFLDIAGIATGDLAEISFGQLDGRELRRGQILEALRGTARGLYDFH